MVVGLAVPAQASESLIDRAALREVLSHDARASGASTVRLQLPEAPRASAAAAARGLSALARERGPGRLLIGLRAHADRGGVTRAVERSGGRATAIDSIGVLAVETPSVAGLTASLRRDPRVAYVERDEEVRLAADPFDAPDPATGIPFTWAFNEVRAGEALAAAGGGSRRQVAVIDSGLDAGHPDLAGRVGRTFDTASKQSDVSDLIGHGTFVAGLISAVDGNGIGGKGVAGATQIYAIRASVNGTFTVGDVLRALDYAVKQNADVANLSLAGAGFTQSQARALSVAFLNDVLPVAASGNRALDDNPLEYPAAALGGFRGRRGIGLSVSATKPDGQVAVFSNHNDFVSLAAPGADQTGCGEGVFSTIPRNLGTHWDEFDSCSRTFSLAGGRWAYAEGTSFSAPIAAGIAALTWQVERNLASEQVAHVLIRSARQTYPGSRWNEFTGAGIVDGKAATDLARTYDIRAPRPRARAGRRGRSSVVARVSRSRDLSNPGRELAGGVTYALIVSTDGGRSYRFAVRHRSRPFRKAIRLRARRRHLLLASVCDRNGNCASKRLGSFRRR